MHDNMLVTRETKTIGWYFSQLNNFNKTGVYFPDKISCEINGCLILEVLHGLIVLHRCITYKYGITDYEYTCIYVNSQDEYSDSVSDALYRMYT